jgi:hypothetical protein
VALVRERTTFRLSAKLASTFAKVIKCFLFVFNFLDRYETSIQSGKQNKQTTWPESASELYGPSDRCLSAKLVPYFLIEGCRVVSAADSLRSYSRFSRPDSLLFLSSSSSVVLTRLSGSHSRPTTFQKIW